MYYVTQSVPEKITNIQKKIACLAAIVMTLWERVYYPQPISKKLIVLRQIKIYQHTTLMFAQLAI